MQVEVLLGEAPPAPADVAGRVVVVVDVLRAATVAAAALEAGARAVIPFEQIDETVARARQFARGEVCLAGERRMQRIDGFDLGNSPAEYTPEAVGGRTVLFCTTNGTGALAATQGAAACLFAGFVTLAATAGAARAALRGGHDLTVVCAGQQRRATLEDTVCAGALVARLARGRTGVQLGDGARLALLAYRRWGRDLGRLAAESVHAQALVAAGYGDDVAACLAVDRHRFAVAYTDRQLVRRALTAG